MTTILMASLVSLVEMTRMEKLEKLAWMPMQDLETSAPVN